MKKLRWGFLGTAGIAGKNWQAVRASGNSVVAAVASRELSRSREFASRCQADAPFEAVPQAFGSYEELLASPEVEAVYIPLPTGLRKEWVLRAAAAGKHVLCEKPCGLSFADVRAMTGACRQHRVQFMDGVMFMHNPRLLRVREILDDGQSVGPLKRITSSFSFPANAEFLRANIRLRSELEPAGCLGDLGWYCIRFTLWAMNWRLPRAVSGRLLSERASKGSPAPTATDFSAELIFDREVSAGFSCSFLTTSQQWANLAGARGALRMDDFVHARSVDAPEIERDRERERVKCGGRSALAQDAQMFRNFARQVRSGQLNTEWPMMALKTQQVMDACFASARRNGALIEL